MKRRKSQASFRLPPELKRELETIASNEGRTLSNTLEMLLRSAVSSYKKSANLAPQSPDVQLSQHSLEDLEAARRIADIILERRMLDEKGSRRLHRQTPGFREAKRKRA